MNKSKRQTLKISSAALLLTQFAPVNWTRPMINTVLLPAHAMTSEAVDPQSCSAFEAASVDEPIALSIINGEARGPITASLNGNTFSAMQTTTLGPCGGAGDSLVQTITFDGVIDSAQNSISGNFITNQTCGGAVVCDQLTTFTATQVVPNNSSDEGDYSGRAIGTLNCCVDFL